VRGDAWRSAVRRSTAMRQAYLTGSADGRASVRVRVEGARACLNIKGATLGVRRTEFEYEIPPADAELLLAQLCTGGVVAKTRHELAHGAHVWEIDEFEGENRGLVVAELELGAEDEVFQRPEWLGEEVSGDARYYNVCLARHPYRTWGRADDAD